MKTRIRLCDRPRFKSSNPVAFAMLVLDLAFSNAPKKHLADKYCVALSTIYYHAQKIPPRYTQTTLVFYGKDGLPMKWK